MKVEDSLRRLLRHSAEGHAFLLTCAFLALVGTLTAAYPVTAVIVPAALLAPKRWLKITLVTALSSALGATALVILFHHMGWVQIYEHFPQLATHPQWSCVMDWVASYGVIALFVIAATPLPQTPALIFFGGVARPDYLGVFVAMLFGKLIKYGVFAWLTAHFPERFNDGVGAMLGRWPRHRRPPGSEETKKI